MRFWSTKNWNPTARIAGVRVEVYFSMWVYWWRWGVLIEVLVEVGVYWWRWGCIDGGGMYWWRWGVLREMGCIGGGGVYWWRWGVLMKVGCVGRGGGVLVDAGVYWWGVALSIKRTQVWALCCCVKLWTVILHDPVHSALSCKNEHLIVDSVR